MKQAKEKKCQFSPYILRLTIKSATNLPGVNLIGGNSDPYVSINIGTQKFVTEVKEANRNPVWNESSEFSVSQLPNSLEFDIYDWNETLADKLIGTATFELTNFEVGIEYDVDVAISVEPAHLQFSYLIQTLINLDVIPNNKDPTTFPQVSNELKRYSTSETIQQAFFDGGILQLNRLTWSQLRDLLADVHHLFPDFQESNQISIESSNHCNRDYYLHKFTRGIQIDLHEHTYTSSIPLPRFSITFQTKSSPSYTIQAANKFVMWKFIYEIRRRFSIIERQNDNSYDSRSELRFNQMYSRYYWPEPENPSFNRLTLKMKYYDHGVFQPCECTLSSDFIDIIFLSELIHIQLKDILSLHVGCEFPCSQPYDLRIDLISGQIDPQAFHEAQIRSKLLADHNRELSGKSKSLGSVINALKKNILPGTSAPIEATRLYMDLLGENFICTESVNGCTPYWNTPTLLKLSEHILHYHDRNLKDPVGVMFHLVSENSRHESCVIGSKFVRFNDLIPTLAVQEKDLNSPGVTKSPVLDHTIQLDQDVSIRIDLIRGMDLPTNQEFKVKCSFVKIDGHIKKRYTQYSSESTSPSDWNHTFVLNSADGFFWASYVALVIKDPKKSGNDSFYGAVYIPKSDFYLSETSSGNPMTKSYPIVPVKGMPSLISDRNLGSIQIKLQLILSDIFQSKSISTIEIKTQLRVTNEYTTSWLCYSHHDSSTLTRNTIASAAEEKFLFTSNYDSILLTRQSHHPLTPSDNGYNLIQSSLHHFQRKNRIISTTNPNIVIEEIEFQIFENQRASALGYYSGDNLFLYERKVFSDESGSIESPISPHDNDNILPPGYNWYDTSRQRWLIEICLESDVNSLSPLTDNEGWVYGTNFNEIMRIYRQGQRAQSLQLNVTRRRKWYRKCYHEIDLTQKIIIDDESNQNDDDCSGDENQDDDNQEELQSPTDTKHDIVTAEVYQNQRRGLMGWGPTGFLLERKHYSNEIGDCNYESKEHVSPPFGYTWLEETWTLDKNYLETDADGWCYGITFDGIMSDLKNGISNLGTGIPPSVRRRRFIRKCARIGSDISKNYQSNSSDTNNENGKPTSSSSSSLSLSRTSQSKSDAYRKNPDHILKLCQERESLDSPVIIPWNQVLQVQVVTMSVLVVTVGVHRYMENNDGQVTYRPVEVEIYIVDCPAQNLCLLIKNRIYCHNIRNDICDLIEVGTMTGQQGKFLDYSTSEIGESLPTLSLGSFTILNLENDILELQSAITRALLEDNLLQSESLQLHEARYKLYISTLLGSSLDGPIFQVSYVKELVLRDIERANQYVLDKETLFEQYHEKIIFLFNIAKSRICDFALCGWNCRDLNCRDSFEGCFRVLINQYYSTLVDEFTKFIEIDFPDKGYKLQFLEFFIEYDDYLDPVTQRVLKYYQIELNPKPIISFCVDIQSWLETFSSTLRQEMIQFIPRIFEASGKSDNILNLPWDISEICTSQIPADLGILLEVYLSMGNFKQISSYFENSQRSFSTQLQFAYLESYVVALEKYRSELLRFNWTSKPSDSNDKNSNTALLQQNVHWICSVANDCQYLLQSDLLQLPFSSSSSSSFFCSQYDRDRMQEIYHKQQQLIDEIIDIAVDYLSCLLFLVSGDTLIHPNPYLLWKEDTNLLPHFLLEFNDWFYQLLFKKKPNKSHYCLLKLPIIDKLIQRVIEKLIMWYLFMIMRINSSNLVSRITLTSSDRNHHLHSDYHNLLEYFQKLSLSIHQITNTEKRREKREDVEGGEGEEKEQVKGKGDRDRDRDIPSQFSLLFHIQAILADDSGVQLFQSINDFTIIAQHHHNRNELMILKKFVEILLKLKGSPQHTSNGGDDDDDDDEDEDNNILADMNVDSLHQPLLLLFDEPSSGEPQHEFNPSLITNIFNNTNGSDFLCSSRFQSKSATLSSSSTASGSSSSATSNQQDHLIHPSTTNTTPTTTTTTTAAITNLLQFSFGQSTRNLINISQVVLSNMMSIPDRRDLFLEFTLGKYSIQTPKLTTLNGNWGNEIFVLTIRQELVPSMALSCLVKCVINRRMSIFQQTMSIGSISIPLEDLLHNGNQDIQIPLNCTSEAMGFLKSTAIPPEISLKISLELNNNHNMK